MTEKSGERSLTRSDVLLMGLDRSGRILMRARSALIAAGSLLIVIAVFLPGISAGDEEKDRPRCRPRQRFGPFSDWSAPVNLGPVVNSGSDDFHPAISPNGLSLYISSGRPGGLGGNDIWVSQRASLDDA